MKALLVVAVTFVSLIGTAFGAERVASATVKTASPIFFAPDFTRTPLRVANEGTILSVRQVDGDWAEIEFVDLQDGPRVGWIQRQFIEESEYALRPMSLSV